MSSSDTNTIPQSPFEYAPLSKPDSIRLLILYPATEDSAEVHCSLIHTTIEECDYEVIDHYTALSYVWGDANDIRTVWIDGVLKEITVNLHSALVGMRDRTRPLRLWADALCIDQFNDREKDIHVGLMGRIYGTAHHTIIYLGDLHAELKSLQSMDGDVEPSTGKLILNSPWFRRIWVFQEFVFSRDPWIQCGKQRWKWDSVYKFLVMRYERLNGQSTVELSSQASETRNSLPNSNIIQ